MKKLYVLAALALAFGTAEAQRSSYVVKQGMRAPEMVASGVRTPTDTLWAGEFENGTPTLIGSVNGGYVVGANGYGDMAKAQEFILTGGPTFVEELIFWFGAKYVSGAANSNITATVWNKDANNATTTVGANQPGPGTIVQTGVVAIADIDTAAGAEFTIVPLSSPAYVSSDFIAGFDMGAMNSNDTIGLVSSADGEGGAAELTWEKWDNGAWYTMLAAWPLDFDLAIWAVVGSGNVGIEGNTYMNGMKMSIVGNPAVENTIVSFDLEKNGKTGLDIYSVRGEKVYTSGREELAAGRHNINVDVTTFAAGTYYVNLVSNGRTLTKKLSVSK